MTINSPSIANPQLIRMAILWSVAVLFVSAKKSIAMTGKDEIPTWAAQLCCMAGNNSIESRFCPVATALCVNSAFDATPPTVIYDPIPPRMATNAIVG